MVRRGQLLALLMPLLFVISIGCENRGEIPSAPPLAARDPTEILSHLQYLAVRKDYKHVVLIAPISPDVVYPSAAWFHRQAKSLEIQLTPEEIQALNIGALANRLNDLPGYPDQGYGIREARLAFNAGLYRLLKGFPKSIWSRMRVMDSRPNPSNMRVMDVTLGVDRQPLMKVSCLRKPDNSWGVSNIEYKVGLKGLKLK